LDVTQAEKKLKTLEKRINKVNNLVNRQSVATRGLSAGFTQAANSANKLNKNVNKSAKSVGFLTKKVKLLANAYLGVMGAQAAINTSDMITSARNKLNNLPGGSQKQTQSTMDKTFAAAQRSRGDYGTMLTNVSKTMTLASDAFQGNVDNAIKFQEIMSKAYTVGGASAAEQSSSMYQLVQALGSGVLQGDELRSVREGAAYAYKEIEKFAQAIYGADENLKDLASEGKITSDIVVAAILNSEDKINEAFNNTEKTFAQVGTNIKNTAIKAFEPVLTKLNEALNSTAGQAVVSGITKAIIIVANAINWLFTLIENVYNFIADNWSVISKILMTIATIIAISLIPKLLLKIWILMQEIILWAWVKGAAVAAALQTAAAWAMANPVLALVIVILVAIVIAVIWVADSFVDACGIIVGSVFWVGAVIYNIIATIINIATGLLTAMTLIAGNIAIAFYNAWQSAKASFWEWVSECLNGTGLIARAVSKIAELFGLDSVSIDTKINDAKSKMKDYYSWDEINSGFDALAMMDASEAYKNGYSIGSEWGQGLVDKFNGLKNKLGLNNDLFDPNSTNYAVDGGYDPQKALDGINDNTGKIADSMDLTSEDLEYLRRVADMEWKKEYTTASITVDMTNNNQINGDGDLDGIVTRLADKLYEEMNVVANGVYAY
jgi:tape measure domain-containing protein